MELQHFMAGTGNELCCARAWHLELRFDRFAKLNKLRQEITAATEQRKKKYVEKADSHYFELGTLFPGARRLYFHMRHSHVPRETSRGNIDDVQSQTKP
jgi:hypothetical protein